MEEERDLVTFTDDEGNEFTLDVIDYFEYEDEEYAVLMDLSAPEDEESEEEGEQDVYIMKVVVNGEMEEFLPADDAKMDALAAIAEERLNHECGCGCGCDDCDDECSEEEHNHGGCGCGCND